MEEGYEIRRKSAESAGGKGKTRAGVWFLIVDGKLERLKNWDTGILGWKLGCLGIFQG